jgi:hypothetical protein
MRKNKIMRMKCKFYHHKVHSGSRCCIVPDIEGEEAVPLTDYLVLLPRHKMSTFISITSS